MKVLFSIAVVVMLFLQVLNATACETILQRSQGFDSSAHLVSTETEVSLCFNETNERFWSKDCADQKCDAWQNLAGVFIARPVDSQVGTPAAQACIAVRGNHRMVQFKINNKWVEDGICLFADGSFVNDLQVLWLRNNPRSGP